MSANYGEKVGGGVQRFRVHVRKDLLRLPLPRQFEKITLILGVPGSALLRVDRSALFEGLKSPPLGVEVGAGWAAQRNTTVRTWELS